MKQQLVFATNNTHKLSEIKNIIAGKIQLLSLSDINCYDKIPETANTLEGNAILKAKYVYNRYRLPCFADDTGLEVEVLNGAPGVYSARYAGYENNSEANIQKLLQEMNKKTNRNAQFRTVIALILNDDELQLFEGVVTGKIIRTPMGNQGFGYDPIFQPDGYTQTFAQLGNNIKNQISHRAKSVNMLCQFLLRNIQ